MKLLSVIIPKSEQLQELCKQQLKGLDYEIISTAKKEDGLSHASGEFVCFMEENSVLSDGYFWENLRLFTSQPSFRKLAVVSSHVEVNDTDIYGYILSTSGSKPSVMPSHLPSSSQPYTVQLMYIPGAIIRRSILNKHKFSQDLLIDSLRLSLRLWSEGSRVYLNPHTTYYDHSGRRLEFPFEYKGPLPDNINQLMTMFKRELIA